MSRTLPPMMQVMRDIGGVEIPETLASFVSAAAAKPATDGKPLPEKGAGHASNVNTPDDSPVYQSSVRFDENRIRAAAIYCSDGRFGEQCDDFLHNALQLPRYDRLAVPGGAACLAGHFLAHREEDALVEQLRFLIRAMGWNAWC